MPSRKSMHSRCVPALHVPSSLIIIPLKVAASNLRFGEGVTREVGMDLKNMKARKVCLTATSPLRPCISTPPGRRLHRPNRGQTQANGRRESLPAIFPLLWPSHPPPRLSSPYNLRRIFLSKFTTKWLLSLPRRAGERPSTGRGSTTLVISWREYHAPSLEYSDSQPYTTKRRRRKCYRHRQSCKLVRIFSFSKLHDLTFLRFTVYKDSDLMDFVNAPVGKGLPISQTLRPLIAGKYPCDLPQYDPTYFQSLLLLEPVLRPPGLPFSTSLRVLSRPVSRIAPSNQFWEWLTPQTPKAVQQKYTSALASTSFSTAWRVILRSRENVPGWFKLAFAHPL